MRYHLFQKFFGKMVKIKETSFLSTRGMTLMFGNCIFQVQAVLSSKRLIGRLDLLKSNKFLWWLLSDQFEFKLLWPCHARHGHMYLIMHLQRAGPIKITDTEQKKVLQFFGIAHVNCVAWCSWLIVAKSGLWGLTFSNCTPNPTNDSGYPFFSFFALVISFISIYFPHYDADYCRQTSW